MTATVSDLETRFQPKGDPAYLQEALDILDRVFAEDYETDEFASDPPDDEHEDVQSPEESIKWLATYFNKSMFAFQYSPRISEMVNDSRRAIDAIQRLRENWPFDRPFGDEWVKIGATHLAQQNGDESVCFQDLMEQADNIKELLGDLSAYLTATEEWVAAEIGSGVPNKPDIGGKGTFYSRFFGHPKQTLARLALEHFERFTGKLATSTHDGPFADYVRAIYAYATGEDPEDGAGLERWIKEAVRNAKEKHSILSKIVHAKDYIDELRAVEEDDSQDLATRNRACAERVVCEELLRELEEGYYLWRARLTFNART